MTIVLGRRPAKTPTTYQRSREAWLSHFTQPEPVVSEERFIPRPFVAGQGGPAPVPVAEIRGIDRGIYTGNRRRRAADPSGQVGLYTSRLDALAAQRLTQAPAQPKSALRTIGRGTGDHYETLYPSRNVRLPQVHIDLDLRSSAGEHLAHARQVVGRCNPFTWLREVIASLTLTQTHRLSNSRRAMLGSMVALVLMAGMATSTLAASQMRYEVREGDTLDSVAAEFGVDREAISRSSWMPNGDTLTPGQVIIIPEPGQSPEAAALMAAERQGTSPWVADVHLIVAGDTFHDIAASYGVTIEDLRALNPDLNPANLIVGERVYIPVSGQDLVAPVADAEPVQEIVAPGSETQPAPGESVVAVPTSVRLPVPNYGQTRNLSCEFAATYAATAAFGPGLSEQYLINAVPKATNPHYGYRGNIDGQWGNTTDYGVYAAPLVPVLEANGYNAEAFYSGGDVQVLKDHLDQGRPVVVWLGFRGDTRERLNDDGEYSVFAGMHAVTVVGYDEHGVLVMDPAKGATIRYDWQTFSEMWAIIDGMGLAIWPKEQ